MKLKKFKKRVFFSKFEDKTNVQFKIINQKNENFKIHEVNSLANNDHQQNTDDLKINIDNKNENIEGDTNNFIKNKLDINDKIKNNTSGLFKMSKLMIK